MRLVQALFLVAIAALVPGSQASAGQPYSIPAHWVDNPTAVEPNTSEFMFDDLSFSSASNGWIVGDKFFLHVIGERIEVTFTNDPYVDIWTVAAPSSDEAWAGGWQGSATTDRAIIWHFHGGHWEEVGLSPTLVRNRHVWKLRFESPERGWALMAEFDPSDPYSATTKSLLHFDGVSWREVAPVFLSLQPRLKDMCVAPSGTGWAVGDARDEAGRWHGVVLKKEGLEWREVALSPIAPGAWLLEKVSCLSTGGMVASAVVAGADKTVEEGLLVQHDGSSRKIQFPEARRGYHASALALVRDDDIWLHASSVSDASLFLHRVAEQWSDFAVPPLPGKGPPYRGVSVSGMQFVSPDEGWAVGTKYYGKGYTRGLVFHYKDGSWRTRNWNWSRWNQRWFGLLGE
ncbi:MAG: hypothetical protein U0587_19980 [Candidatus Binatia bacterium]